MFRLNLARGFANMRFALMQQTKFAAFHTSSYSRNEIYNTSAGKAEHVRRQSGISQPNPSFHAGNSAKLEDEAAQSIQRRGRGGKRQRLENQPDEMVTNAVNPEGHLQESARGMAEGGDVRQGGLYGRSPKMGKQAEKRRENYLKDVSQQKGLQKNKAAGRRVSQQYAAPRTVDMPNTAHEDASPISDVSRKNPDDYEYAESPYYNIKGDKKGIEALTPDAFKGRDLQQNQDSGLMGGNSTQQGDSNMGDGNQGARPSFETGTPGVMRPSGPPGSQGIIKDFPTRAG